MWTWLDSERFLDWNHDDNLHMHQVPKSFVPIDHVYKILIIFNQIHLKTEDFMHMG